MKLTVVTSLIVLVGIGVWALFRDSELQSESSAANESEIHAGFDSGTVATDQEVFDRLSATHDAETTPGNTNAADYADPDSSQVVAVFDGEINVRVYSVDAILKFIPFHEEPIATYYDSLKDAADAGDTDAALELGFVLLRCIGYATTKEELEQKVDRMLQTHLIESTIGQESRLVDNIQPYIEIEQQRYEICKGLSNEQVTSSDEWFDRAAELGDYFAQAGTMERGLEQYWLSTGVQHGVESFGEIALEMGRFAKQDPERFRQSFDHLNRAREQGSLQSLRDLALLYSANAIKPQNIYSSTANAYANLRAASEVFQQIWGPGRYTYKDDIQAMSEELGINELKWAEAQARAILREPNCCKHP